jgi:hypothetical protein
MPALSPASVYLDERGWQRERVAVVMRVQPLQLHKYFGGHRRVSPGMKTRLVSEFGDAAYTLVEICDRAWRVNRDAPKPPRRSTKRETYQPPAYDGPRYTFDEWVERFGRPGGGGADVNGRFSGYFDTEPCWLGE